VKSDLYYIHLYIYFFLWEGSKILDSRDWPGVVEGLAGLLCPGFYSANLLLSFSTHCGWWRCREGEGGGRDHDGLLRLISSSSLWPAKNTSAVKETMASS
jgi:hypothetical protein